MELFIAKLIGIYFIIVCLLALIRREALIPTVKEFIHNRPLLIALASIEIIAGLALIIVFPKVAWTAPGIISLVGYMLVVEGIIYFSAPQKFIRKFIEGFNIPQWYIVGGLAGLVAGIFLAGKGFGFF